MFSVSLAHLSDVEGCETHSEDDQHRGQQLDSFSPPLPKKTQVTGTVKHVQ